MTESFMQAIKLPASAGLSWLVEGWRLFRRQPLPMLSWALMIGLMLIVASLLPLLGSLLFLGLMPALTVMTMQASADIASGRSFAPFELIRRFSRSPHARSVLKLGALYAGLLIVVGAVSILPFAGQLAPALQGLNNGNTPDWNTLSSALAWPVLIFAALYLPLACAFWYAPALIAWHGLSLQQSLFFSAVACWRNKSAFLVYGVAVLGFVLGLTWLGDQLFALLQVPALLETLLRTPVNFLITAIVYCSFFPSYVQVFHRLPPADRRRSDEVNPS